MRGSLSPVLGPRGTGQQAGQALSFCLDLASPVGGFPLSPWHFLCSFGKRQRGMQSVTGAADVWWPRHYSARSPRPRAQAGDRLPEHTSFKVLWVPTHLPTLSCGTASQRGSPPGDPPTLPAFLRGPSSLCGGPHRRFCSHRNSTRSHSRCVLVSRASGRGTGWTMLAGSMERQTRG